jgi:hypothetical protein
MVIVRLNGGLGNQLFQYAAGRRLSIFHRTPIKLDVRTFDYHKLRHYSLAAFRIKEACATPSEIAEARGNSPEKPASSILQLMRRFKKRRRWSVVREAYLGPYNPGILNTNRDVYLDGYWQSEKYFKDVEDVIRSEFTVQNESSPENESIASQILNTDSVSIHVRRADYVLDPATHETHGVCGLEYYQECIHLINERVAHPYFFVFSDDLDWCRENLRFDHSIIFVTHQCAVGEHEDLRLMSLCKHNIIANSSFSWWGAWLNTNKEKIVMSPRRWFKDQKYDTSDLIPEGWMRI